MSSIRLQPVSFDVPGVQRLLGEWNEELAATILGFSPSGGSTVTAEDFVAPRGSFLLAVTEDGAAPAGCGGVRSLQPETGEVKRLVVARAQRGRGIGRALLAGLEQQAHRLDFRVLRLDTMGGEPAALALFQSAGYRRVPDYNGNPRARYWFEKRLAPLPRGD